MAELELALAEEEERAETYREKAEAATSAVGRCRLTLSNPC